MVQEVLAHPRLRFLARYGISGATGAFIQLSMDVLIVEVLDLHYQVAVVVGFLTALAIVFLLQKHWTFREPSKEHAPKQFSLYTMVALGSLAANAGFMHFFIEFLGLYYLFAHIVTIAIVMGSSFLVNNFVTFRDSRERFGS
jgi:putative flippase GtrA